MSGMHRDWIKASPLRKQNRIRLLIQLAAAAVLNGYAAGFLKGKIFTGKTKLFCVPVLNCYSCPGALGSCPIGALQAVAAGTGRQISFYVLGILMLFGVLLGRFLCGFLCPFGLIQDLLHKIPGRKFKVPAGIDKTGRYLKYVILALVFLLPAVLVDGFGLGTPFFCKYFCPAGTLEGGVFHLLTNGQLRSLVGGLFWIKAAILAVIILGAILTERPFCRYFCPLGAFYGLFNRFALYGIRLDESRCIRCGKCEMVCPMDVRITKKINTAECIRCGKCRAVCEKDAISIRFILKTKQEKEQL